MKRLLALCSLGFLVITASAHAAETGALFKVSGSTASIQIETLVPHHYYPSAGIKLTTPGTSIASGCSSIAKGYCLFGISDIQPVTIQTQGAGKSVNFNLCLDGSGPTSCQKYTLSSQLAYVTNYTGDAPFVSLCTLNTSSGDFDSCIDAAADASVNETLSGSYGFIGIALDPNQKTMYLSLSFAALPQVYQCSINAQGFLSACSYTTIGQPTGYMSDYGMLTTNSTGTLAYLVSEPGTLSAVLACPIVDGVISTSCENTGALISSGAVQIALNSDDSLAYIGSYDNNYVTVCSVSAEGTTFSSCQNITGDNASVNFSAPAGVAFNSTQSRLYLADYGNGNVYGCTTTITGNPPHFTECFTAMTGLSSLNAIAINANNTIAYITNFGNVYVCPIDQTDGTFTSCTPTSDAPGAVGIALPH